jgi:hypothetical protein
MKIQGDKALIRKLRDLPRAQRDNIRAVQAKNGAEGVRVAKTLVAKATGGQASTIKFELSDDGMVCEIVAGGDTKRGRIQANTLEGGRDANAQGGAMAAQPFIGPTRSYLAKKFKGRIQRAIRAAIKEVGARG